MKRIVRGNDFTMRIPVVKIVEGEKVAFPLPGCTDIVVRLCSAYRRLELAYTIDAKEDNVIVARVEGDKIPLGTYALEVRGKIFGNDWRSNEYEQVAIVDRNADADTELDNTDEGEDSVEMDTAVEEVCDYDYTTGYPEMIDFDKGSSEEDTGSAEGGGEHGGKDSLVG